jgi:S1-C subfamily serine protease
MDTSLRLRGRLDRQAGSEVDRPRDFRLGIRFDVGGGRGLTINSIERSSLFFDSGLRRGDVIVSAYGRPIRSEADFVALVRSRPGVRIPVVVFRDGREEIVYLMYEQDVIERSPVVVYQEPQVVVAGGFLGVMFDTEIPDAAVVRSVFPQSPAAQIGLRAGDEIIALNGEAVSSYRYAVETIEKMRAGEPIGITYRRQIENQTEAVLAPRPGTDVRTASRPVDIRVSTAPAPVVAEPPNDVRVVPVYPRRPVDREPSLRNYR